MGYRYIGSKARIADEIIEYVKETATMESGGFFVVSIQVGRTLFCWRNEVCSNLQ